MGSSLKLECEYQVLLAFIFLDGTKYTDLAYEGGDTFDIKK